MKDFACICGHSHHHRKRRIRKKRRLGEFAELGFEVTGAATGDLMNEQEHDAFMGSLANFLFDRGLTFGGGWNPRDGLSIVISRRNSSATEEDRTAVAKFLSQRHPLLTVSPPLDMWHLPRDPPD